MKNLKIYSLLAILFAIPWLNSCGEEEIETALANFESATVDVDPFTLDPVTVTITLTPAAGSASSITVDLEGGEGAFTTTPALSGSSIEIPIDEGASSVSFTMTFDRASLPDQNLQVRATLGEVGANLGTGITTSTSINVPFINIREIPYAEPFGGSDVTSCDEVTFPPEGWTIETPVGVLGGGGDWQCVSGAEGVFVHTGVGMSANAFNTGETIETYIISPIVGPITSTTTMSVGLDIRFDPNGGFPYDVDILTSTDYNGLNFETATWTSLEEGRNAWLSNDFEADDVTKYTIDLSSLEGEFVSIAFFYNCPDNGNCGIARFDDFEISN